MLFALLRLLDSSTLFSLIAAALAALAGSQLRTNHPTRPQGGGNPPQAPAGNGGPPQTGTQTHEMTVPNELIGCIIGKGGTKIAEIR